MANAAEKNAPKSKAAENTALVVAGTYSLTKEVTDEDTGEVMIVPKYKYYEGNPRDYRADMGATGGFNIGGKIPLGLELKFQPIAWRGFRGDIFKMGEKDWIELYFIDKDDSVGVVLFHGFSCEALVELVSEIDYANLKLNQVILTAKMEQKQQKTGNKATYYIASFTYEPADAELVKEYKQFAKSVKIYRKATLPDVDQPTDERFSVNWFNPNAEETIDA